jgi:hypothetical protein
LGAAAVRGKEGVVDTTRMVRQSPFGEWVNVFYDPKKIKPETMLKLIIKEDCPKAKQTIGSNKQLLNPFIAPGDPVQFSISAKSETAITDKSELPSGWKIVGKGLLNKGENVVTLTVPRKVKAGSHTVKLVMADGKQVEGTVTVVSQVGKH